MPDKRVGIIGLGTVGVAAASYYADADYEVIGYDPAYNGPERFAELNEQCHTVLICVPTPAGAHGTLDCSAVEQAVASLHGKKQVFIKSTVNPGFTDYLQEKITRHSIYFWPEFLDEDTACADFKNPRRPHIVGVPKSRINTDFKLPPADFWPKFYHAQAIDALQAELLKLGTNFYYALRVGFANAMYDMGMTQETLNLLRKDWRIGDWGLQVFHKGYRGFGGKCLPKDVSALYAHSGADQPLLSALITYNSSLLEDSGYENNS